MRKLKKSTVIVILVTMAVLSIAAVYAYGVYKMKDNFPANTYVNDINMGGMNVAQANEVLAKANVWDGMEVSAYGETLFAINADEIDSVYDGIDELTEVKNNFVKWRWFLYAGRETHYDIQVKNEYNKEKLYDILDSSDIQYGNAIDARVEYSEETEEFVIVEDRYAFQIDKDELYGMIEAGVTVRETGLPVDDYVAKPAIASDSREMTDLKNEANKYLSTVITYDFGDRTEIVDKELIKDWITIEAGQIQFDLDKVKEYERLISRKYDTYGDTREFRTSYGETIKIKGGTYGWLMQVTKSANALIEAVKQGEDKTIEPVYSYSVLVRDTNDIGNSYVEICLATQTVFVYINGELKIETPCVTGNTTLGRGTPTGVFPISYKERDATLTGEDYSSGVSYWMPFNSNIGMHDAPWRTAFGGEIYKTNGSHGCINLPPENAAKIYEMVYKRMAVVVY
ncbi:L,D-transpeptidase family protein [Anaerobium acetethylicum]|uniref:Putative peptidoglycan binding domain-containing protein n=1 Tax=Anaerobium acetethylicum TaxID=1619234 RepID=A0A1D3TPF1_9FIRM|nr:L,D-transpeptidase family protein [Anaerobium acetethylicum]SCP95228.1 Putative peptidoglycan binding domain-containing protein [Anaerobium acetethylicum]